MQAYLFPFVRTLPINIPKDISLKSLSSDVATIDVSIPKMAIKDTAIISIGNFNIEKYSRAEQSDPQIGYVPLLHVAYKDYQDLGGESLPKRIVVNQYSPASDQKAASGELLFQMLCIEFIIAEVLSDKPDFDRKLTFADFEGQKVSDMRYEAGGRPIHYDYSSILDQKSITDIQNAFSRTRSGNARIGSIYSKWSIMGLLGVVLTGIAWFGYTKMKR